MLKIIVQADIWCVMKNKFFKNCKFNASTFLFHVFHQTQAVTSRTLWRTSINLSWLSSLLDTLAWWSFVSSPQLSQFIFGASQPSFWREIHSDASDLIWSSPPSVCLCCPGLCLPLSAVLGSAERLSAAQHQEENRLSRHETARTEYYLHQVVINDVIPF